MGLNIRKKIKDNSFKLLMFALSLSRIIEYCKSDLSQQDQILEENLYTSNEAWEIAMSDARVWADDAEAALITRTDNHDTENPDNGVDGKR